MNKIIILLLFAVLSFAACKSSKNAKAEYKEFESPKRINHKKAVVVPEVDVDEIIKKNP